MNTTHEEFVTIETARLLKKAGFNWSCYHRYLVDQQTDDGNPLYYFPHENFNEYNSLLSAPTQAVAQRWLREVKNKVVLVSHTPSWEVNKRYHALCTTDNWNADSERTYEAALEAGLQKCLTLLIEKQ